MTLFDMPVSPEAGKKISDQRGRTRRQKSWLKIGIHPASLLHIVENGETCGSCGNLVVRSRNRTYFKCGLVPETHGPGSDIRKKWPACTEWKETD